MVASKRTRGFARLADVGPEELGLPAPHARRLRLAHAWAEVAGEPLASHVAAVSVRRGVLEVEAEDERWAEALADLLARLAGRLAALYPALGVRKLRIRHGQVRRPAVAVTADPSPGPDRRPTVRERGGPRREPQTVRDQDEDLESRLRELAARYLERAAARRRPSSR